MYILKMKIFSLITALCGNCACASSFCCLFSSAFFTSLLFSYSSFFHIIFLFPFKKKIVYDMMYSKVKKKLHPSVCPAGRYSVQSFSPSL